MLYEGELLLYQCNHWLALDYHILYQFSSLKIQSTPEDPQIVDAFHQYSKRLVLHSIDYLFKQEHIPVLHFYFSCPQSYLLVSKLRLNYELFLINLRIIRFRIQSLFDNRLLICQILLVDLNFKSLLNLLRLKKKLVKL